MSDLFLFITFGLAFLLLLLLWARRSAAGPRGERKHSEAPTAFSTASFGFPVRSLGEQIFSAEDWDFVSGQAPPPVQRLFLQERTAIALAWLRQTRAQVRELLLFYRTAVRRNVQLSPAVEVRIFADYLFFLLVYDVLFALIWLRGPFSARNMAGQIAGISDRLFELSGRLAAGLDPARVNRAMNHWPPGPRSL